MPRASAIDSAAKTAGKAQIRDRPPRRAGLFFIKSRGAWEGVDPNKADFLVRLPEDLRIAGGVHRNTPLQVGKFPRFHRLSERVVAWRRSDLGRWIKEHQADGEEELKAS